jgi:hypothetical protein
VYIHKQSNESAQKHIPSSIHSLSENASPLDDSNGMQRVRYKIIAGKFNVSTDYDKWKGHFFFCYHRNYEKYCETKLFQQDSILSPVQRENDINDRASCRKTGKFITYIRNHMERCEKGNECDFINKR